MTRTESERLFESSFCKAHVVACRRVTETTEPRPDYELEIAGQQVLVEIKQFDPNEEERAGRPHRSRGARRAKLNQRRLAERRSSVCYWSFCSSVAVSSGPACAGEKKMRQEAPEDAS